MKTNLRNNFKKLDLYGEAITFNIDGEGEYTTVFGALLSLLILTVVFRYGSDKFVVLQARGDTTYQEYVEVGEIPPE